MRAILEADLRIPGDIAVVRCGNLSFSNFLRVPLTSVDQGRAAIGEQVAALTPAHERGRVVDTAVIVTVTPGDATAATPAAPTRDSNDLQVTPRAGAVGSTDSLQIS